MGDHHPFFAMDLPRPACRRGAAAGRAAPSHVGSSTRRTTVSSTRGPRPSMRGCAWVRPPAARRRPGLPVPGAARTPAAAAGPGRGRRGMGSEYGSGGPCTPPTTESSRSAGSGSRSTGRCRAGRRPGAKWQRQAGITGVTLHDLRHFFASGLTAGGCDVVTVQRALGAGRSAHNAEHLRTCGPPRRTAPDAALPLAELRRPTSDVARHGEAERRERGPVSVADRTHLL